MKKVLLSAVALLTVGALSAQELKLTYNANLGIGTLGAGAATEVYWHSGAGLLGPWEAVVGNWGMADGVGEMTESADDIWEIVFDPATYYNGAGYDGTVPIPHIGMVFRNGDGTLEGKGYDTDGDGAGNDIFAVFNASTLSYDIDCDCVTIELAVNASDITSVSNLNIAPMPFAGNVQFSYFLNSNENVSISIYNMMGAEVASVFNGSQPAGAQVVNFDASELATGNYIYRMTVGTEVTGGSIVKL
jgi:hypothetical protein